MSRDEWTAVDDYLTNLLVKPDSALREALNDSSSAGLPSINVSPEQGKLLHIVARAQGARSILEIGTLGGYSTIWLARALPADGRLITLEINPAHAEVARKNVARAGVSDRVEVRLGKALETLPQLLNEGRSPFDLFFIDADKPNIPEYFNWALKLSRPGSLIIVDNVVRGGKVIDGSSDDPSVQGVRRFNEMMAREPRVTATTIQTVGSKGYDGLAFAFVLD